MFGFNRWLTQFQSQALEEAYQGAQAIKTLEEKYFNGQKITYDPVLGKTTTDYLQTLVDRQLARVRFNLAQVRLSGFFQPRPAGDSSDPTLATTSPNEAQILAKLNTIEAIVGKYRNEFGEFELQRPISELDPSTSNGDRAEATEAVIIQATPQAPGEVIAVPSSKGKGRRVGSFLDTAARIRKELSPAYEQEVVRELRSIRKQQTTAIRWLVILLIVPVIVQITTRNLIFEPLLDYYRDLNPAQVTLSQELQDEFLDEFSRYREALEIRSLMGLLETENGKSAEELKRQKLQDKAAELYREAGYHALDGLKNLLADGVALGVFTLLVYLGRKQLITLRGFTSRAFLGLNDPTKVFLLILITDMFVGFHSVEGWDVILGTLFQHFGLPENQVFIKSFIATVPVIMDSLIKFWIFNFLTRSSPSAVAILEKMNQ